eukprot:3305577-Rhodomonas_salina.2
MNLILINLLIAIMSNTYSDTKQKAVKVSPTRVLCDIQYRGRVCCYRPTCMLCDLRFYCCVCRCLHAMQCQTYGTDVAYDATRPVVLTQHMVLPDIPGRAILVDRRALALLYGNALFLRACYEMSGTDLACDAMPGADLGYGSLRICYAVSSTIVVSEVSRALRCPFLTWRILPPGDASTSQRPIHPGTSLRACYAISSYARRRYLPAYARSNAISHHIAISIRPEPAMHCPVLTGCMALPD